MKEKTLLQLLQEIINMPFELGHKINEGRTKPDEIKKSQQEKMTKLYKCPYCNDFISNTTRMSIHIKKEHSFLLEWKNIIEEERINYISSKEEYEEFLNKKVLSNLNKYFK
jgi:uncharacterized C2H2 Zn-finger protein